MVKRLDLEMTQFLKEVASCCCNGISLLGYLFSLVVLMFQSKAKMFLAVFIYFV